MAAPPLGVWGIDLGQCGLKAVRLQETGGAVVATAFDYVEHPKILSQPDADPDQLTREALAKFLSRNSLRGDLVCIGVPGQSGLARFVKLPPVEEKKIGDIVKFEARQQIPFNLDEVVWDYQKIGAGIVTDGFAIDTEIGLFAIKRDMVNRALQHFKDLDVDVHVVQMAPLALCNYVAYDLLGKEPRKGEDEDVGRAKCVIALDTGADSSNLVITDGERVIWQRPIPLGGNHFTRALTKDLKLTFAKAEHLKRNATKSPDLKKILAALRPVLNDFVGEVQRSLGYFTNTHKEAQIDYMVGLGNAFRLPGLQKYLAEKLQLDVRRLSKLERIGGESVLNAPIFSENLLTMPVAVGLALQGLEKARLTTNLLPGEIRIARIVRAKKPWAVAAAASLLVAVGAVSLSIALEYKAYGDPAVVDAVNKSKSTIQKVSSAESAFAKAKQDAFREEAAVKAIVAGQAEHVNWLDLLRFISECIPLPDGSNLPREAKVYWQPDGPLDRTNHPNPKQAMTGAKAFEEYKKRLSGFKSVAVTPDGAPTEDLGVGIDDLIQFNIEAVDCRFADDLPGFWKNVKDRMVENEQGRDFVRPTSHWERPPEDRGWVVELRGYTYNYKGVRFIIDSLLENIAQRGMAHLVGAQPAGGTSAPGAPGATPGAPGGAPPPVAAAAPAPQDAAGSAPAAKPNPIHGRVSHVTLFRTTTLKTNDAGSFVMIGQSALDEMLQPPAAAAGEGGMGGPGAAAMPAAAGAKAGDIGGPAGGGAEGGGGRANWAPLLGSGGFAGDSGDILGARGKMPGAKAGPAMPRPAMGKGARGPAAAVARPAGGGPGIGGPGVGGPGIGGGDPSGAAAAEGAHLRTEFIIFFVWKEPTPSDALRGDDGTPGPGAGMSRTGGPGAMPK